MSPQEVSFEQVRRLAGAELSLKARVGYVALLLVAAAMTVVVVSLWATEPALPIRTQLSFGVMAAIGASWVALAAWVLTRRRPLFARDRVIAGTMAVVFTSLFVAAALVALGITRGVAAFTMLGTGVVMLALATRMLRDARRRFGALVARRHVLEAHGG